MKRLLVASSLIMLLLTSCASGPEEIHFGHDECEFCRMIISEPNFASQMRTSKGMVYKFDSIECLAALEKQARVISAKDIAERWVPDFETRTWVDAREAYYLHSETLRSPMGLFISAYETEDAVKTHQQNYLGNILSYEEVMELVQKAWLQP